MLRQRFGLEQEGYFDVMPFLELIMPQIDPDFAVLPVEDGELPGRAAVTIPDQHIIKVRETVYNAACKGVYFARFVMAHELGHYILHAADKDVSYAYPVPNDPVPHEVNAEWQSDVFASELLAPVHLIGRADSDYLVQKHFGVTARIAKIQLRQAQKVQKRHQRRKDRRAQGNQ